MSKQFTSVAAAVASALAMGTTSAIAQSSETPWDIELTPYIWAAGIDADVRLRGHDGKIDMSASDIVDQVDIGGSLLGVGRRGHFVTWTQLDYIATDTDQLDSEDQPAGGNARFESDLFFGTLAFGYQFGDMRERRSLDLLLGARYMKMDNELTVDGVGRFKKDRDLIDGVIIARPSFRISDRWRFNPTFSVGAGDSNLTYELQPQIQFQITDSMAARFGYRRLYYDVDSNGKQNKFDGSFQGLILGLGGTFGGGGPVRVTQEAAPAPAPQPVAMAPSPPPPPPPGDGDQDGIADNIDKCPGTASGEKVDAIGCGVNVKIAVQFETNSATLTPESTPELDRLVDIMGGTSVISGVVEGYTDSTGSSEYNKQLSDKRAQAVADYLISHGVSRDRVTWKGRGEANPVADNSTAEGRAENRRVVLKRIDAER
ncbi:MAG TPA: OmpA family protein [Steroidobacteraceae bacterium]|nr:OmpA family protein [Steroidobacteraceae bacterium]